MRIIVDLPEYLILQVRELVREGRYGDISSFLATSIENQLMLDKTDIESGTVLVQEPQSWRTSRRPSIPSDMGYARADYSRAQAIQVHDWRGRGEGDWLWGQVNKMLPIKFAVRLLANEITKSEHMPVLEEFADRAAATARVFGLSLKAVDEREGHRPGAKLSTGFPVSDKIDRAQQRFKSQFVGQLAGNGRKSGALPELNLGNIIERNGHAVIGLTRWGLEFAALPNPLLDEGQYQLSLSDQEIDFYLDHIRRRVPWEASAFALILSIVTDGIGDREQVNRAIRDRLAANWSRAETNTQRAGAMSRMFDLRLLSSARRGRRVEYRATERGEWWMGGAVEGGR
jgi:Arc/MetJ-type ribon-helix-helix transcriptional regulator